MQDHEKGNIQRLAVLIELRVQRPHLYNIEHIKAGILCELYTYFYGRNKATQTGVLYICGMKIKKNVDKHITKLKDIQRQSTKWRV